MIRTNISFCFTSIIFVLTLFSAGCVDSSRKTTLALKFQSDELNKYKIVKTTQQTVDWQGEVPNKTFKKTSNDSVLEMVFTQQVQSFKDNGNAVIKITIDSLKYSRTIKNNLILDFDSTRERDQKKPMAKLIGHGYIIELSAEGKVEEVIDAKKIRLLLKDETTAGKTAKALFSNEAIKQRHGAAVLPAANKKLNISNRWTDIKAFSFGLMGSKAFEKIYTLKDISSQNDQQIAIIEMEAIPTSEMAEEIYEKQKVDISKMFDSTSEYTGQMKFNITTGKLEQYEEKMDSSWIVVEPTSNRQDEEDKEPAVLIMNAHRSYTIERVN